MIRNQNIASNVDEVAFLCRDNAINGLKVNLFFTWSPLCPKEKYLPRMDNWHKSIFLVCSSFNDRSSMNISSWSNTNRSFYCPPPLAHENFGQNVLANLCLDAPHSVLTFIGLVHSAHLFGTLGQMFAIRAGKRVTQQNGILLKTNEWKLCLIKVGPCFFGWGSINSNFFFVIKD